MAIFIFSVSALFIVYVLFVYPLALVFLSTLNVKRVRKSWTAPTVSIVLPVHNGERWIAQKLRCIADLDYPRDLIQIIVIDDGSTDRTAALVREFPGLDVELISIPRSGKASALNVGIMQARGKIIVFTDVRQPLGSESVRRLIENFGDPTVGVVSSDVIILSGETQQEANIGLYWRYEKWIRRQQSQLRSLLGATGCLYAIRRELAKPLPADTLVDDVWLPAGAILQGYAGILEDSAVAFDYPTVLRTEFRRKVRTQAGMLQLIIRYPRLLIPRTRLWFHFVSHKVGRLLLPYAVLGLAVTSFWLPHGWRQLAAFAWLGFIGLASVDSRIPQRSRLKRLTSIPLTFMVLVGATLCAVPFLYASRGGTSGWPTTEVQTREKTADVCNRA